MGNIFKTMFGRDGLRINDIPFGYYLLASSVLGAILSKLF
jgi:hypothetical protein